MKECKMDGNFLKNGTVWKASLMPLGIVLMYP